MSDKRLTVESICVKEDEMHPEYSFALVDEHEEPVAWENGYGNEEDMNRLAACWNLCQGTSTKDLESGKVAVVATEDYRLMERALRAALNCLPDPDRPTDVYAMANPFAVAVTVKEALSRIHQSAPTTTPKGSPLIRHGKCDYCGNMREVRPTPILADAAEGALTCESCWNVTREGGIATEGIDVGEFWDVGQKPAGGE